MLKPLQPKKFYCAISACLCASLLFVAPSFAQDRSAHIRKQIEPYVEQVIIQSLIEQVLDVINRTTQQANIGILPNFAYLAAQQTAIQVFKQEQTLEVIRTVYDESVDLAVQQFTHGASPEKVQESIATKVKDQLVSLNGDYVFQQIVQLVIQQAYMNQQQYLAQQAMRRGIQNLAAQQREAAQALQQQYRQTISSMLIQ